MFNLLKLIIDNIGLCAQGALRSFRKIRVAPPMLDIPRLKRIVDKHISPVVN